MLFSITVKTDCNRKRTLWGKNTAQVGSIGNAFWRDSIQIFPRDTDQTDTGNRKIPGYASNQATTTFFHNLPNLLCAYHPAIEHYKPTVSDMGSLK
jgi:hypothetical protein